MKKKIIQPLQYRPCLAWHVPSPVLFCRHTSPCTPQYDFTPHTLSQHVLLSFPFHLFTQNHRNTRSREISGGFVSHIYSLCSMPVLPGTGTGARRWRIFDCRVNFGLGTSYRGGLSAVVPGFAIATCGDEGSQQLCLLTCNLKQCGPWALQC